MINFRSIQKSDRLQAIIPMSEISYSNVSRIGSIYKHADSREMQVLKLMKFCCDRHLVAILSRKPI